MKTRFSSRIATANKWRTSKVSDLQSACTAQDKAAIAQSVNALTMYASRPADIGFSSADLQFHIARLQSKLTGHDKADGTRHFGLVEVMEHKQSIVARINTRVNNNGGRTNPEQLKKRDSIASDVSSIAKRVRGIERAIAEIQTVIELRAAKLADRAAQASTIEPETVNEPVAVMEPEHIEDTKVLKALKRTKRVKKTATKRDEIKGHSLAELEDLLINRQMSDSLTA